MPKKATTSATSSKRSEATTTNRAQRRAECRARYATPATDRPNRLKRIRRLAEILGLELLPWQEQVIAVATEYDPLTGIPAYRTVFITTPRQSGKTTVQLLLTLDRCIAWTVPQTCVWTGQDATAVRQKWVDDIAPMIERSKLELLVKRTRSGELMTLTNGNESIEFVTKSKIRLIPSSPTAGHGKVTDFAIQDELFADKDSRRDQALSPGMITKPYAQTILCSTAGDETSVVYNRYVTIGRQAVADGRTTGVAYFEWSAPDDWDESDEDSYWEFMPALGHTIRLEDIRHEREKMQEDPGQFARAYGNQPEGDTDAVFPLLIWRKVTRAGLVPDAGGYSIGVDVNWARDRGAIAVADSQGQVKLAAFDEGTGWIVERARELSAEYGNAKIYFDTGGPAGGVDGLRDLVRAEAMNSREVIEACGAFYDAVADADLVMALDQDVDLARKGLAKKETGDRFVWSRKLSENDVTPLYAVTLAWSGSRRTAPAPIFVSA